MRRTFAQRLLQQGIAASKSGQNQDALRLLLKAVELDPDCENAWLWLSSVIASPDERKYCLEQVLELNPDNAHARSGLIWLERDAFSSKNDSHTPPDDGAKRKQELKKTTCPNCRGLILAHSSKCEHCHRNLIVRCPICDLRANIDQTVCGACGNQFGDFREGAGYYAALGNAYLDNHKSGPAIVAWRTVLEMQREYPDALLRLGEAQLVAGDLQGAYASFAEAIGQGAESVAVQLSVGQIYERHQRWDEALMVFEQALADDESSAAVRFALGQLLMEGRALQDAFIHIHKATELDAEHTGAWYLLGYLYEMAEEKRKAIRAYQHATDTIESATRDNGKWRARASDRLEVLRPSLPPGTALNWPETVRQTAALAVIPAIAALVNGGLRPWHVAPLDYIGFLVATLGAYFWVSALTLPRNPGMRAMLGQNGLSSRSLQTAVALLGALFWAMGVLYILLSPIWV